LCNSGFLPNNAYTIYSAKPKKKKRSARSFALISAFLMGKFFLIIPTAGKSRSCSSCKKMYMGLKSFMVRSAKAVDRLFVILPLAHFYSPF
jgi:hypothetical protein